jgi:hypothetical protein
MRRQSGIALVAAMLMVLLVSCVLVGFTATVMSDQQMRGVDRARTQAFYAAHAGLEKLTTDLGNLFTVTFRPTGAQVNALTSSPPVLPDISFAGNGLESGYRVQFPMDTNGNPVAENRTIVSGPFQGFVGLLTPYAVTTVARTVTGAESSLARTLQTVSIPVFQFGIFSETDLSFFAGPDFDFGGRVHTNGNLFLAEGDGNDLTLSDRVTAVAEVIRTNLSNLWDTNSQYRGNARVTTVPGVYRNLGRTEGSLVGTVGSARNEPTWTSLSIGTYNGNIRNNRTGARRLDLPLVRDGAVPIDIIRRPNPAAPDPSTVLAQRFFMMASLRILLSDTAAGITSLPTITPQPPVNLENIVASGYVVDGTHPPIAAAGTPPDGYASPPGTPLVTGFIKIERQTPAGLWVDVTLELLNRGIAGRNLAHGIRNLPDVGVCTLLEPNPNAVIRLQRVRDNPASHFPCGVQPPTNAVSQQPTDYWPNVLYDAREGNLRDNVSRGESDVFLGGVVHYIELDMRNLTMWLQNQGAGIMRETGYVVYFSDRRQNRNAAGNETSEYGFEDFVNPNSASGTPDGVRDLGEDVNGSNQLDLYGQTPIVPIGGVAPLNGAARPWTLVDRDVARVNRPIFFRRALKVVNGRRGNIIAPGLTIASENPVYLQGDFNALTAEGVPVTYNNPHAATAIIADAVTFLSNSWNDIQSFRTPHNPNGRPSAQTTYRVAIVSGKGQSFPRPSAGNPPQDFGTDGGVHNFLRYIENWSGRNLNYRGSIVSFYTSRQAVGTYKCCSNVYSPPTRNYQFDTDFLQPSLLPPRTPMFRDVNTTGFSTVTPPVP